MVKVQFSRKSRFIQYFQLKWIDKQKKTKLPNLTAYLSILYTKKQQIHTRKNVDDKF